MLKHSPQQGNSSLRRLWLNSIMSFGILSIICLSTTMPVFAQRSPVQFDTSVASSSGQVVTFNDNIGSLINNFEYVFNGTAPATVSLSISGCAPGGTCNTSIDTYTTVASVIRTVTTLIPYNTYQVTVTWTGGDATTNIRINRIGVMVAATVSAPECVLVSAASTNATNCKSTSGVIAGYEFYNTTTTVYYLRLYNLAAAPTCSSATGFIRTIPVPPASAAGQVGGAVSNFSMFVPYTTGIGFCFTGGSGSTDNTNAAVGVFGAIRFK